MIKRFLVLGKDSALLAPWAGDSSQSNESSSSDGKCFRMSMIEVCACQKSVKHRQTALYQLEQFLKLAQEKWAADPNNNIDEILNRSSSFVGSFCCYDYSDFDVCINHAKISLQLLTYSFSPVHLKEPGFMETSKWQAVRDCVLSNFQEYAGHAIRLIIQLSLAPESRLNVVQYAIYLCQ